jgi:hypothetical protein
MKMWNFAKVLIPISALMAPIAQTAAQQTPTEKLTAAANNLGHELVTCTAFFYITAIGMLNRSDQKGQEMAAKQRQTGDYLMQVAGHIAKTIEQKPEVLGARLEMEMGEMRKEMSDNFVNYSLLQRKYMEPCVSLAGNVEGRINALVMMGK